MNNGKLINARDLPIVKLVPRSKRKINKKYHRRIEASIRAVGLIEPLVVYPVGDQYEILDGCLRYFILLEMGVEMVPCLIRDERESFTGNRMVNRLSAAQEMRMLRKSLEELDEKTIADALGMAGIKHRLNQGLLKKLDATVAKAFEAGKINKSCASELAHVKPDRHRRWSKQRVVRAILARHQQGLSLDKTWKEDRVLYDAAHRRFRRWPLALAAAGMKEFGVLHHKWTRESIIEAIRDRHACGLPLTGVGKHDSRLYAAALRHFTSWHEAVRAAGLEPRQRGWSKERVIKAIQDRYIRELPLSGSSNRAFVRLKDAAKRYFGCWKTALAAAGLARNEKVE